MNVGFVGTGFIAAAMARGIAADGHRIRVSERSAKMAEQLAGEIDNLAIVPNAEVVAGSDVVVLCLLADVAREVLPALPFRADQSVVSVMADAPLDTLRNWCAPATDISITIPLPAIARGGTHLPVYPDAAAVAQLFGARNRVATVRDETALNAHFAATALCSSTLAQMRTARNWLAGITGDADAAESFVVSVLQGCMRDAGDGIDNALAALATEGGLNATLRAHMAASEDMLRDGLDGFRPRLNLPPAK